MELINTATAAQDKWMFLRKQISDSFALNPASAPPFIGRHTTRSSLGNAEIFQFTVWIMIFSSSDFIQLKHKRNLQNFPFSAHFFSSVHYDNVAGTTAQDMINQKKCKASPGEAVRWRDVLIRCRFHFTFDPSMIQKKIRFENCHRKLSFERPPCEPASKKKWETFSGQIAFDINGRDLPKRYEWPVVLIRARSARAIRNLLNFHYTEERNRAIRPSDRWSQNINLWTRFSSLWLFRLLRSAHEQSQRRYPQSFNIPSEKERRMKWDFIDIGHEHVLEKILQRNITWITAQKLW